VSEGTSTTAAAGTLLGTSRRRRRVWGRAAGGAVPYVLIAPVVVVIGVVLGYPLYWLGKLSLEHYTLFELISMPEPGSGSTTTDPSSPTRSSGTRCFGR